MSKIVEVTDSHVKEKKLRITATVDYKVDNCGVIFPLDIVVPENEVDRVVDELNSRYYLFDAYFDSLRAKYGRDSRGGDINIVFGTQEEDDVDDDY